MGSSVTSVLGVTLNHITDENVRIYVGSVFLLFVSTLVIWVRILFWRLVVWIVHLGWGSGCVLFGLVIFRRCLLIVLLIISPVIVLIVAHWFSLVIVGFLGSLLLVVVSSSIFGWIVWLRIVGLRVGFLWGV